MVIRVLHIMRCECHPLGINPVFKLAPRVEILRLEEKHARCPSEPAPRGPPTRSDPCSSNALLITCANARDHIAA